MTMSVRFAREALPGIIRTCAEAIIASGSAENLEKINDGLCGELSSDVLEAIRAAGVVDPENVNERGVTDFVCIDPKTGFSFEDGGPFDRVLLKKHWQVSPPDGFDWNDMDRLSADAGFHAGTHVFLHCDGLFYDAEAPDGVPSFFELPFFRRVIASWREERLLVPAV